MVTRMKKEITERRPLGSIKAPGFTSMQVYPGQRYILYPPKPGEEELCQDECAHYGCVRARKDANARCPECGLMIGYGGPVPVNVPSIKTSKDEWVYEYSSILLIHADCYDRLCAMKSAVDFPEGLPSTEPDPLMEDFLQEITENPTGIFAQQYLKYRIYPEGVRPGDVRLAIWVMQHTYPNTIPAGAEPPTHYEPEPEEKKPAKRTRKPKESIA